MNVTVLYNQVGEDAGADERDVLAQVDVVTRALRSLGAEVDAAPVSLDLASLAEHLDRRRPDVVFNLVEGLHRSDRLILAVPALLETLGVRYTGARLEGLLRSTNKVVSKELLSRLGIPTPAWSDRQDLPTGRSGRVVIKSRWSHGSVGLFDTSVLDASDDVEVRARLADAPGDLFVEEYVEGREFNLSLLAGPDGPQVLPPAEIRFDGFEPGRPHIVGYRAKWVPDSQEYKGTPRTFDFDEGDERLLERLREVALAAYRGLGMYGYARVDFRVDGDGTPLVLEVNANPCLAEDAGFLAAAARGGLTPADVVGRILADTGDTEAP